MKWVDYATMYIPVFGKMDMVVTLLPKGVRLNLIFHLVAKPALTTLGANPVSSIPFSYPNVADVADFIPDDHPFSTGWTELSKKPISALVNIGKCWWPWSAPTTGLTVFGLSPVELFSSAYSQWLGADGINLAIADSYLLAPSKLGGPLDIFGFRRAQPLQVGGKPWFAGAPPLAGTGWLGLWGGSFATADRFIPNYSACTARTPLDVQKHLGLAPEQVTLSNGKIDYEVSDVTAEYFAAKPGAFPNPIIYLDSAFPTPGFFELMPPGATKALVLRFGFNPEPSISLPSLKNGIPISIDVSPCRFTVAKVRLDQLVV